MRPGPDATAPRRPPIAIEPTDPDDGDACALLNAHARDMAQRYPGGSWAGVGGPKDRLWLARDEGGSAVGCVALRVLAPHLVEVKHLYVAPDARRRGVAGALMDTLEAEAARRRAAIILETGIRQPEAIALYRARGYGDRARYPQADADAHHSVYLGRDAAP